jgi:phosphatidylglycerophosphatase C
VPARDARPVVAAFDVDGTVTEKSCVVPFLRRVAGTPRLTMGLGRQARHVVPAALRRDRDALKAQAARVAFRGRRDADVQATAIEFAADLFHRRLRPDVLDRLAWHRDAGHRTVLVSASFAVYLRPLAAALGVHDVVATELEVVGDRCTGELLGGNCRGVEKVARLHRWLDRHHGGRSAVELWAYGDSSGDRELLADADHGIWVEERLTAAPEGAA